MSTFNDMRRQLNIDENLTHRVIVRLAQRPSSNGRNNNKTMKSGLVRISNANRFRREDKKLRNDLKLWIPISSQINELGIEILERMRTESKEFYDVVECVQYVSSCAGKRVILILFDDHAKNRKIASNFTKFSQIIAIYRCATHECFENWSKHWSFQSQSFIQEVLARRLTRTPIKELDEASQLLLMQICLTELIVNLPNANEAKEDFLDFCRSSYKDNPVCIKKIEDFERTYDKSDAVKWYTRADSFVFRIVSKTCASLDFAALFKIRFILRDLYVQLQKLHQEQLETLLQRDLTVYRGKTLTQVELNHLKVKGELFVTRHFLSTTTEEEVANMFFDVGLRNENKVSVLICMHIERTEMQDKPIAFLRELSQFFDENEVMLPMGLVFRTDSYEEIRGNAAYSFKITMVRGKDEKKIEKNLSQFHLIAQTGAICATLGMAIFLRSIQNGEHVGKYCNLMSRALKSSNNQLAEQLATMSNSQSLLTPTNAVSSVKTIPLGVTNIKGQNEGNHLWKNTTDQLGIADPTKLNHAAFFANTAASFQQPRTRLIAVLVTVLIVATVVVIPVAVILSRKANPIPTICPRINCTSDAWASNISAQNYQQVNYQIEGLNLTCPQSLSNLTIILAVQRTFNEIHHKQNQTFNENTTNMTYVTNPSQIIYTWQSLPNMQIDQERFPHMIEIHFNYTSGSMVRVRSNDTWQIWLQSSCGVRQYLNGTYD